MATTATPAPTAALPASYQRTPYEQGIFESLKADRSQVPPSMKVLNGKGAAAKLEVDHPDQGTGQMLLLKSLGTADFEFLNGIIKQLANVGSKGAELSPEGLRFMLSMVQGIEPRDQVETMLAAQMAAAHNATMTFARRLNHVENIPQQDSAERAFNKLARTFAAQVEALKRYRSSGDQTVRVEHVTVKEGGQAIVGNVSGMGQGSHGKSQATP